VVAVAINLGATIDHMDQEMPACYMGHNQLVELAPSMVGVCKHLDHPSS